MTLTPDEIRNASFETARRGLDAAAVHRHLVDVADTVQRLTSELESTRAALDEARAAEESLRRTMIAMSRAREEILDAARNEARHVVSQARREAERRFARAEEDAAGIVMEARRQALDVVADARRDADHLLRVANAAAAPLTDKIEQLRAVVRRTENLMRGLASGALGELAQAHLMLDEAPIESPPDMQIVFSDADHEETADPTTESPLPAAVDRLLSHLREIG